MGFIHWSYQHFRFYQTLQYAKNTLQFQDVEKRDERPFATMKSLITDWSTLTFEPIAAPKREELFEVESSTSYYFYGIIDSWPQFSGKKINFILQVTNICSSIVKQLSNHEQALCVKIDLNKKIKIFAGIYNDDEGLIVPGKKVVLHARIAWMNRLLSFNGDDEVIGELSPVSNKNFVFFETLGFLQEPRLAIKRFWLKVQQKCVNQLRELTKNHDEVFAFMAAFIFGERRYLHTNPEIKKTTMGMIPLEDSFRGAGIFHVLSVSGLHMAIFAVFLFNVVRWLLLRIRIRTMIGYSMSSPTALCVLPLVWGYAALTGFEAPTARSCCAITLVLLAKIFKRQSQNDGTIAIVAFVMLLFNPKQLFLIPFQLSFVALIGLIYFQPLASVICWLEEYKKHVSLDSQKSCLKRVLLKISIVFTSLQNSTIGAWFFTLPLTLFYFQECQGTTWLGNFILTPIAEIIILPVGLILVALSFISTWFVQPVFNYLSILIEFFIRLTHWIALLPWNAMTHIPSASGVMYCYVGCLLICLKRKKVGLFILLICSGCFIYQEVLYKKTLRVNFLSVGQGDGAVLELPQGGIVLVDTGGIFFPVGNAGEKIIVPFLRKRGYKQIDLLIVSHFHPDHIGGLKDLLMNFKVKSIWSPQSQKLIELLPTGVDVHAIQLNNIPVVLGQVELNVLYPCADHLKYTRHKNQFKECNILPHGRWKENDNSLVVKVSYFGHSFLFTGDLEEKGELELVQNFKTKLSTTLVSTVMKAPHHCSKTSSGLELLQAVSPRYVVCSVGHWNRYKFPHAEVMHRYQYINTIPLRTDMCGTIQFEVTEQSELVTHVVPTFNRCHLNY